MKLIKRNIVHYWGGCPVIATSKWQSFLMLIKKCADNGWENWLVLSHKPDDVSLIDPIIETGCKIIYQPRSKGNFDFKSIYRNFQFLKKIKCDVFHCYNDHTSPLIGAAFARVPVRIWSKLSMSSYYELGTKPKGLERLMISTRITCILSNRILVISDIAGQEIAEQVGFDNKIVTVHVPVSIERFVSANIAEVRKEFGFCESDIIIVTVGRAIKVKGWDIAIKAFVKVHNKIPNAKLLLIGKNTPSTFYRQLRLQVEQSNLKKDVFFIGQRNDIPEILKKCDVFILPSRSEGTPAALVEAMASGLPCVATEVGGIPEVIQDGVSGLLFRREEAEELADDIINIVGDCKLKERLINNAKSNLQKFEIDTYVNQVVAHYNNLLK